jgi:hypothetical protein
VATRLYLKANKKEDEENQNILSYASPNSRRKFNIVLVAKIEPFSFNFCDQRNIEIFPEFDDNAHDKKI